MRAGLAIVVAVGAARAFPSFAAGPVFSALHDVPLLLLVLSALAERVRTTAPGTGRRLWALVAASYLYWLSVRVLEIALGAAREGTPEFVLARDLVFLGFYVCLIIAAELRPERGEEGGTHAALRAVRALAAITVACALLAYLSFVPGALDRAEYASRAPSFLLYGLLDGYVAVRFLTRSRAAGGTLWREPLRWLGVTASLWAISDLEGALVARGTFRPPAAIHIVLETFFALNFVALLAAVRAPALGVLRKAPTSLVSRQIDPVPARRLWGGPAFAYLVALPLLQLALDTFGVLDPERRELRETLVLVTVAILAVLAVVYERLITAENARLAAETQERRRQAQRLEALGQLAAGIAHDFNNVMTIVLGSADFLSQEIPHESPLANDVRQIQTAVKRGAEMVRRLLAFGRQDRSQGETVDVGALVVELSKTLRRLLPETIVFEVETRRARPARARPAAVEQILVNIVTNARDAMPKGGRLHVKVKETTLDAARCAEQGWGVPGRWVVLAVTDTGVGMTDDVKKRLFDPFFTTKEVGRGTGLGMAMVSDLVRLSRGHIDVLSSPGQGTRITVSLPTAAEAVAAAETPADEAPHAASGETILVVEDEPQIRRLAQRTLEKRGYRVLTAADGRAGLELFDAHAPEIALVISDVVMPHLTGPELYDAVRAKASARFIFTTGYSERETQVVLDPKIPCLHKPWSVDEMVKTVRETLETRS